MVMICTVRVWPRRVNSAASLFQDGRVPGDIQVYQNRAALEVEPHSAGIGGDKNLNVIVFTEPVHQGPPFCRGHSAVEADIPQSHAAQPFFNHPGHELPLGKDHRLQARLDTEFIQDIGEFIQFG